MGFLKGMTGLLAFVGKELTEIMRSPAAVVSLVVGPLLIIFLFGVGFSGLAAPLRGLIVVPADSGLPTEVADYAEDTQGLEIVDVLEDREAAVSQLDARTVDVVLVAPADLEARLAEGERATVEVLVNLNDPIAELNASHVVASLSSRLNERIIAEVARRAQEAAGDAGAPDPDRIPPEVIAAPTTTNFQNVAPVAPSTVAFYGAALLPFVLQHLAVSLVALSIVRERTSGSFELFRVAPVGATEIIVGKAVALALISAVVAIGTTLLLVNAMGVPLLSGPLELAGTLALVIAASIGLGVIIGIVSGSERQVVQAALLVLLASVFFTGLVLKLELFVPAARPFAYLLPATHGIELTQDLMLYGWVAEPWHIPALAGMALLLVVVGTSLFRRQMTHG
jgi:ABC-2 type transport system permease protein